MVRDKNPTLKKTCIICRNKITVTLRLNSSINDLDATSKTDAADTQSSDHGWRLKAMFMESFCMAFGLPVNHPFLSIFVDKNESISRGRLCYQCFEDVSMIHDVLWQLQGLEKKLTHLQSQVIQKLRSNYDALPVSVMFARMGLDDVGNNFENLKYDEIVKILFERIKDSKGDWPKPVYSKRWKESCEKAQTVAKDMKDIKPVYLAGHSDTKADGTVPVADPDLVTVTGYPLAEDHDYLNVTTARPKRASSSKLDKIFRLDSEMDEETNEFDNEDDPLVDDDSYHLVGHGLENERHSPVRKTPLRKRLRKKFSGKSKLPRSQEVRKNADTDSQENATDGVRLLCVEDPDVCCRTYSSRKHLLTHIKSFHKDRTFVCDYEGCTLRYETQEKLDAHKARVHEKAGNTEVCEACGIELLRKDMKRHYYLRHVGIGKFSCEICSMDFNDSEEYKNHEGLHKQVEFPFACVVCDQLFTNSLDLRAHVSSNHLSSGLKCDVCGIMKPNDFLLRRHMKVHQKVKSFICSECGKSFTSKAYLNYHLEHNHENAGRKYPCDVCGKQFTHLKNVLRHMVTHREEKPFKCKICSKTFNYSHLLKKHEEIHSNTKNYECEACGKRFRQEQNLRQHMKSHRPKPEKPAGNTKKSTQKQQAHTPPTNMKTAEMDLETFELKLDPKIDISTAGQESEEPEQECSIAQETIITVPNVEVSSSGHIVLPHSQAQPIHQIQLTLPPQPDQPQGTTTVVFVTADQNFHWIT